jgi:hypothetical protein
VVGREGSSESIRLPALLGAAGSGRGAVNLVGQSLRLFRERFLDLGLAGHSTGLIHPSSIGWRLLLLRFERSGQIRQCEFLQSLRVSLALSREADNQLGEGVSRGLLVEMATAGQQNLPRLVEGNLQYCQRFGIEVVAVITERHGRWAPPWRKRSHHK